MNLSLCVFFVLLVLICSAAGLRAQITISKTDVDAAIIGRQYITQHDTLSASYDLGSSGNNQTWDFSSITAHPLTTTFDTSNYTLPAGQLLAGSFPGAAACITQRQTSSSGGYTTTFTIAAYYSSETDGVYGLGLGFRQQISPAPPPGYPFPADTSIAFLDSPRQLELPLPLTNDGTTRTSTDTLDQLGSRTITTLSYTTAGSGTVTLPGGGTEQVIRVLEDKTTTTHSGSTFRREIVFYAKDGTQVTFHVADAYTAGATNPQSYNIARNSGVATDVRAVRHPLPAEFRLEQNYPNPFNPSTVIGFAVPKTGHVSLRVYNVLGEQVAVLVDAERQPGSYREVWNASGYPSGVYYCRLDAAGFTGIRKIVLAR